MNYYDRISEANQNTKYKAMVVSHEFANCKQEVDKVCMSIKKLVMSTKHVLEIEILGRMPAELVEQYQNCLKYTISIAFEDVDRMIKYYNVTRDEEIKLLRQDLIKLLDEVAALF